MSNDFDRAQEEHDEEDDETIYENWEQALAEQNELFNRLMKDEELSNVTKGNLLHGVT